MLAGDLPTLKIEGVAVAVVRRHAEDADLTVVFEPAQLTIVRAVALYEIPPLGAPGRTLGPQRAGPQAFDRRVALDIIREQRIDDDDVGIEDINVGRSVGAEVARRAGDDARRRALFGLGHHPARPGDRGAGGDRTDQSPAG